MGALKSRDNADLRTRDQFCTRLDVLSAFILSTSLQPHVDSSSSSENKDEASQAPAVTTSVASKSPTTAAASASDDCCEVCLVAPRAGFILIPCGHAFSLRQRTMPKYDKDD